MAVIVYEKSFPIWLCLQDMNFDISVTDPLCCVKNVEDTNTQDGSDLHDEDEHKNKFKKSNLMIYSDRFY